jgi:hypothetical protein
MPLYARKSSLRRGPRRDRLMDPAGNRAFISCMPDNYIAVIDLRMLTGASWPEVDSRLGGLAWAVRP